MDTLSDLRSALQSDLSVNENSSLFPPDTIDAAINRAYVSKAARLFRWPKLEDSKTTASQANIENYDLPDGDNSTNPWSIDSAWRLEVDGDYYGEAPDYSPMVFQDYLDWKADDLNANSTKKKWAVHGHQVFIYPTPTTAGLVINMWGQKVAPKLDDDTDTTIFSYTMPEGNEAILLEAKAILKHKGEDEKAGEFFSIEAKQILSVAFNKIKQEQAKYEKTQPMFNVRDMFGRTKTSDIIGDFS